MIYKSHRIEKLKFYLDIERVLNNKYPKNEQVKVRENTPKILLIDNIKNFPILITQRHIKSIIYGLEEAKKINLPTKNINYHGLGKTLFYGIINNLDKPRAIYKKDDNNYIIITKFKDFNNRQIIIPFLTNGKGLYKNSYINENQIKSIYGRNNLEKYLTTNNFKKIY